MNKSHNMNMMLPEVGKLYTNIPTNERADNWQYKVDKEYAKEFIAYTTVQ